MKAGRKEYSKPTPKKMRVIGDTLLALSGMLTVSFAKENATIVIIASVFGIIGKFLTNFFSE